MAERSTGERIAVVTGVSRRAGIGFAIAQRLLRDGARVLLHSFSAHDAAQTGGADPGGIDPLIDELGGLRIGSSTSRLTSPPPMLRGR